MDVFGHLRTFLSPDKVCIDNIAFRTCTKATFVVLISASLLVTARQYIGDPIDCIVDTIPSRIMDTYCWFYSTYTLTNRLIGIAGRDIVRPGVATELGDNKIKYHKYYQWVCFVLFFQAIASYMPRYMWKRFEGDRLRVISIELENPVLEKDTKDKRKRATVNYIVENVHQHTFYAYRFFLCEMLNFGIALGQIYFTNYFLDGEFWNYGLDVIQSTEEDVSPMARIFPRMTKCTFHKYRPFGSIQKFDGLCILPVNNINEKIYLFLWFWFICMVFVSGIAVIYRVFVCCIRPFRFSLLRARGRLASRDDIRLIFNQCDLCDWFLIYQLTKNIDCLAFRDICRDLTSQKNRFVRR